MIYLVIGENQFRVDEAVARVCQGADEVVRLDGSALSREALVEALFATSLFAAKRVVCIDELSKHKALWEALPELYRDAEGTDLVLLEPKPDKRLKAYKWLAKEAKVVDCGHLHANDTRTVEKWLADYAAGQGVTLTAALASDMVRRAVRSDPHGNKPIIDQQLLATAVMQLQNADTVTPETVDTVLAPSAYENVFNLLGTVLDGRADEVAQQVATMRHNEEAYMVVGLLASQLTQLTALVLAGSGRSVDEVAKATGAHPFALRQMQKYAGRLSLERLARYIDLLRAADAQIKTSSTDPWTAIDIALAKIALDK